MNYTRTAIIGVLLTALSGCGRSELLPVAGRITIDGKPVDCGLVTFEASVGPQAAAGATIDDGRFATVPGRGLRPGIYLVSVQAMHRTGKKVYDRQAAGEVDELVAIQVGEIHLSTVISADNSQALELGFSTAD